MTTATPTVEAVRLYTIPETADQLRVSRGTVYNLINARMLRSVELGTDKPKQRVRADDLQQFIDDRTY